jgi:hypothetical protein
VADRARLLISSKIRKGINIAAGCVTIFEVSRLVAVGLAIEEILLISECSLEGEWEGQVRFLPLPKNWV